MHVEVKYTYKDLLTAPDDGHRYEVFEGELIMTSAPSRAHQKAHSNLFRILSRYVHEHALGELYSAPFDVYFDEETDAKITSSRRISPKKRRASQASGRVISIPPQD